MFLATYVLTLVPLVVYVSADQHKQEYSRGRRTWALNAVSANLDFNALVCKVTFYAATSWQIQSG